MFILDFLLVFFLVALPIFISVFITAPIDEKWVRYVCAILLVIVNSFIGVNLYANTSSLLGINVRADSPYGLGVLFILPFIAVINVGLVIKAINKGMFKNQKFSSQNFNIIRTVLLILNAVAVVYLIKLLND
ncbi:MAG: hypothetical protein Q8R12_03855 [bacterium]|nr:hypothetical protein [bacterium]